MKQAVILAGGLGTRLRPLTYTKPKSMATIQGKPFLYYILQLLQQNDIAEIVLCLGYKAEQIRDYFGQGQKGEPGLVYSVEKEPLGTAGALKSAEPLLDDSFFVLNGDTYLPISYQEAARFFMERGKQSSLVAYDNKEDTDVTQNLALADDLVTYYDKSGTAGSLKFVDAGVLMLRREVLKMVPPATYYALDIDVYPQLINRREMSAFITSRRFFDIGTPQRLADFEAYIAGSVLTK